MTSLAYKFTSLPSLLESTKEPIIDKATSLLNLTQLHAMTAMTFEIEKQPEIPQEPSPHLLIQDSEIFLDMDEETENVNLVEVERKVKLPDYNPEHSLYAKVQADVSRWNKSMIMDEQKYSTPALKREIKQIKTVIFIEDCRLILKAIAHVIKKKSFAAIKPNLENVCFQLI